MKRIVQLTLIISITAASLSNANNLGQFTSGAHTFLMNLIVPGYKYTDEQKKAARQQINSLQKRRETTTNKQQLKILDQQIYQQKVITGDAWSQRRRMVLAGLALAGTAAIGFYGYKHYTSSQDQKSDALWQNLNIKYLNNRERHFTNENQIKAGKEFSQRLLERINKGKQDLQSMISYYENKPVQDITETDKVLLKKYRKGLEMLTTGGAQALEEIDKQIMTNTVPENLSSEEKGAYYWIVQYIANVRRGTAYEHRIPIEDFNKALYPEIAH